MHIKLSPLTTPSTRRTVESIPLGRLFKLYGRWPVYLRTTGDRLAMIVGGTRPNTRHQTELVGKYVAEEAANAATVTWVSDEPLFLVSTEGVTV